MRFDQYQFDNLTPGQSSMRNAIAVLPLGDVQMRVQKEATIPHTVVEDAIDEYRKFLFLIALGNHELAMCSKEVDEVWHGHILFTQEYNDFCARAFGAFVHHRPATPSDPVDPEGVYRFRTSYESVYGPIHPLWNSSVSAKCVVKPPFCDGEPAPCDVDCGCKCKGDDDDDDDDDD